MFNIILIFIILIAQNLILLNEEILILFCFIVFVFLTLNNISSSMQSKWLDQTLKIEDSLESSLTQIINLLINWKKLKNNLLLLPLNFQLLSVHIFNLTTVISKYLPRYFIQNYNLSFPKKFYFIQRLEQQVTKLLVLFLIKKLTKFIVLKQFYTRKIIISNFVCFKKINIREYIEII